MADVNSGKSLADRAAATLRNIEAERVTAKFGSATVSDRAFARAIDLLVLGGVLVAIMLVLFQFDEPEQAPAPPPGAVVDPPPQFEIVPSAPGLKGSGFVAGLVALVVFYELASSGQTIGRRRSDLRIVRGGTSETASAWRLALRTMLWAVPLMTGCVFIGYGLAYPLLGFGLLFAMAQTMFRDSHGRPMWDIWAGTQVVRS
jgi:uncharacterized RDD family membrane protein YckC